MRARVAFVVALLVAFVLTLALACRPSTPPTPPTPATKTTSTSPQALPTPIAAPAPPEAGDVAAHAGHDHGGDDPHGEDDPDHLADGRDHRALFVDRIPIAERNAVVDVAGLIETNGPFAYDKDGSEFHNREKKLPKQPRGFYREYTVDTPGSSDRGARRLVAGKDGSLYYTRDHYQSFVLLREPRE